VELRERALNETLPRRGLHSGRKGFDIGTFSLHYIVTPRRTDNVSQRFHVQPLFRFLLPLKGKRLRKERVTRDEEYFA